MMKMLWLKKLKRKGNSVKTKEETIVLPTAKEALEGTKAPQLRDCINKINTAIEHGWSHTYVTDHEKLHQETIDYLIEKDYDVKVTCYKEDESGFRNRDEYYNEVYWHEGTTGKYSYTEK